jgi:hypothetical protein
MAHKRKNRRREQARPRAMDKSHTAQNQDNTTEHGHKPADSHVSSDITPPKPKNPSPPCEGGDSRTNRHPTPWWTRLNWQLIVEIMVFIVGVRVAVIYSGQLKAMLDSNEINRQTLVSVQRPFLTAQHLKTQRLNDSPGVKPTHSLLISVFYENSGTTPAIGVINYFGGEVLLENPTEDQFKGDISFSTTTTIGPKATREVGPITKSERDSFGADLGEITGFVRIAEERKNYPRLTMWGWAVYRDQFPNTTPHLTEFCRKFYSVSSIPPNGFQYTFGDCSSHNCTDEDCDDYPQITAMASSKSKGR